MRHRLARPLVAASLVVAFVAPPASIAAPPPATAARTCSAGFEKARVGGHVKCLRAGEYCAKRFHRAYRGHGFKCVRVHGTLRLKER
jgi:hypothetical protein